ncbi:hypothetical protein NDN08_007830 [Rhodosorus marinus]|uniref:Uncharacterized protein n=1 Tax=Rhodosorus marinus TaxID=101924 RepID=A0AAV8UYZ9_9RHOD|nr:hypothetical protein NDN08_007830 [Rhodosorus marinus]
MKVAFAFVLISLMGSLVQCKQNVFVVHTNGTITAYAGSKIRDGARPMQIVNPRDGHSYMSIMHFGKYAYTWEVSAAAGIVRRWDIDSEGRIHKTHFTIRTSSGPVDVLAPADALVTDRIVIFDRAANSEIVDEAFVSVVHHETLRSINVIPGRDYLKPDSVVLTSKYLYIAWGPYPRLEEYGTLFRLYDPSDDYDSVVLETTEKYNTSFLTSKTNEDIYAMTGPHAIKLKRLNPDTLAEVASTDSYCPYYDPAYLLLAEDRDGDVNLYEVCDELHTYDLSFNDVLLKCESSPAGANFLVASDNKLFSSGDELTRYRVQSNGCPTVYLQAPGDFQGMLAVILY